MSYWHVNSVWTSFWASDGGPVEIVDCSDANQALDLDMGDSLSDPTVEDLFSAGAALWPVGAAWGSPDAIAIDSGSVLAGLNRALLSPFADLYRLLFHLVQESLPATLVTSLDDWELEYGLPDPCATQAQTEEQRRVNLSAKVALLATITPADMVRLAARLGFVVALEEPEAFRVGESSCGPGGAELSNTALEQQFVIHIHDLPVTQFQVGVSEVGVDRLLDFDIGILSCVIRRISPAWTYPIFSIAALRIGPYLVTEEGRPIVTETGRRIIAPIYA